MATEVNCPYEDCDIPLDTTDLDDGEVFECPDCGRDVEVTKDGNKLIVPVDEDPYDDDEEYEPED